MSLPNLDRAVEPHENVLIGNFIFLLGALIGHQAGGKIPWSCINLIRQTPNDKSLGDVLARFPEAARVLEFKRSTNDLAKEKAKLTMLQGLLEQQRSLISTSRKFHWFIESLKPNSPNLETKARPYLDMQTPGGKEETGLLEFAKQFVWEALEQPCSQREMAAFNDYLKLLAKANGSKSTSAGGLIVCLSRELGLSYMPVRDFREIGLEFDKLRADYANELLLQRELTKERNKDRSIDRNHDFPSL